MLLTRPSLTLFLLSLTCSFISVSATLETGTWHCPSHIHINHYSNTTSTTTTSSTNQAPPPCNDTSTSPIITNPKPKPARDYKPACCDYLAPFKDVNGEFAAQGCFGAGPVEGRRRGQYTCFLDEVVNGVGLRTKQGSEACCYDVDGRERDYVCVGVVY